MKHNIWPYLFAAYTSLHVGLRYVLPYFPDPPEQKSWYSVLYHSLEYFAVGNGKSSAEPPK